MDTDMIMRQVGRPPIPAEQRKTETIKARLTTTEIRQLDHLCRQHERNRSDMIRYLLSQAIAREAEHA